MIIVLPIAERILYSDLKPWLTGYYSEAYYRQRLTELTVTVLEQRPRYDVRFPKPLTALRRYYHTLIVNEIAVVLNDFHRLVRESITRDEVYYLVNFGLTHTIALMLSELENMILKLHFSPDQYALGQRHLHPNDRVVDSSWVLHLLKHQMVRLYLEIQDSYCDYLLGEPFTLEDLYNKYFDEPAPQPPAVVPMPPLPCVTGVPVLTADHDRPPFTPVRQDLRETIKGVPTYRQLVKDPALFSRFEQQLCKYELIDANYRFIDRYGNKTILAAIYHQLINKGFFQKRFFPGNLQVPPRLIRKFLDHRYQCDIDKQFRLLADDPSQCQKIIDRYYWISVLNAR